MNDDVVVQISGGGNTHKDSFAETETMNRHLPKNQMTQGSHIPLTEAQLRKLPTPRLLAYYKRIRNLRILRLNPDWGNIGCDDAGIWKQTADLCRQILKTREHVPDRNPPKKQKPKMIRQKSSQTAKEKAATERYVWTLNFVMP